MRSRSSSGISSFINREALTLRLGFALLRPHRFCPTLCGQTHSGRPCATFGCVVLGRCGVEGRRHLLRLRRAAGSTLQRFDSAVEFVAFGDQKAKYMVGWHPNPSYHGVIRNEVITTARIGSREFSELVVRLVASERGLERPTQTILKQQPMYKVTIQATPAGESNWSVVTTGRWTPGCSATIRSRG
jgi:hypothetical protein